MPFAIHKGLLVGVVVAGVIGGVTPAAERGREAGRKPDLRSELEAQTRGMMAAFDRGAMKEVAAFYADDARIYGSGLGPIVGRRAIDEFWARVKDPRGWELTTLEIGRDSLEPYQMLRSVLVTGVGRHPDTAQTACLLVWRRDKAGRLRIKLDVYGHWPRAK